jgi:hypothetical protein
MQSCHRRRKCVGLAASLEEYRSYIRYTYSHTGPLMARGPGRPPRSPAPRAGPGLDAGQRQGYMYCDGYMGLIYPWEVGTLKTIWRRSLSLRHTTWLDWTWPNAVFSQISFQKISPVLCFCRCIAAMMAYKLDGHCCSAVDRLDGRLARGQQKRILLPQFLFICRISFVLSQIFVPLTIDFKRII